MASKVKTIFIFNWFNKLYHLVIVGYYKLFCRTCKYVYAVRFRRLDCFFYCYSYINLCSNKYLF